MEAKYLTLVSAKTLDEFCERAGMPRRGAIGISYAALSLSFLIFSHALSLSSFFFPSLSLCVCCLYQTHTLSPFILPSLPPSLPPSLFPSLLPSLPPSLSLPSSFPPSLHASHACYSRLTIPSTQSSEETFVSMEVCTNILHEAKESVKRASVVCVHSLLRKRGRALPLSLSAAAG